MIFELFHPLNFWPFYFLPFYFRPFFPLLVFGFWDGFKGRLATLSYVWKKYHKNYERNLRLLAIAAFCWRKAYNPFYGFTRSFFSFHYLQSYLVYWYISMFVLITSQINKFRHEWSIIMYEWKYPKNAIKSKGVP